MKAYPSDSLGDALRNIFDFDIYKPETIDKLAEILIHHGYALLINLSVFVFSTLIRLEVPSLGLEAARGVTKNKVQDVHFEPKATDLSEPKEGEHDDKEHHGGNKWAGGVGYIMLDVKEILTFCHSDWRKRYRGVGW